MKQENVWIYISFIYDGWMIRWNKDQCKTYKEVRASPSFNTREIHIYGKAQSVLFREGSVGRIQVFGSFEGTKESVVIEGYLHS